jgi:hypothetical protein
VGSQRSGWRRPDGNRDKFPASGKAVRGRSDAIEGLRPKGLSYGGTFESTGLPERVGMRTAQKTRHYRSEKRARSRQESGRVPSVLMLPGF